MDEYEMSYIVPQHIAERLDEIIVYLTPIFQAKCSGEFCLFYSMEQPNLGDFGVVLQIQLVEEKDVKNASIWLEEAYATMSSDLANVARKHIDIRHIGPWYTHEIIDKRESLFTRLRYFKKLGQARIIQP